MCEDESGFIVLWGNLQTTKIKTRNNYYNSAYLPIGGILTKNFYLWLVINLPSILNNKDYFIEQTVNLNIGKYSVPIYITLLPDFLIESGNNKLTVHELREVYNCGVNSTFFKFNDFIDLIINNMPSGEDKQKFKKMSQENNILVKEKLKDLYDRFI